MSRIFKAWVPNVSGRLSFRKIGDSIQPARCEHVNDAIDGAGTIIAIQIRRLDDSLKLQSIRKYGLRETKHQFVLVGDWKQQSSKYDSSEMTGYVAMIPWSESEKYQSLANLAMKEFNDRVDKSESIDAINVIHKTELKNRLILSDYFAGFSLSRDGELTLRIKKLPKIEYLEPEVQWKKREHELAGEFYFYIRDIAHAHRHHSASNDKILDVIRVGSADDQTWIKKVFADIRRHCINMSRSSTFSDYGNPSGFLAYAESFKLICDRKQSAYSKTLPQFTEVHFSPMKASIDAHSQEVQTRYEQIASRTSFVVQVSLAVIAATFAAIALLQLQPDHFNGAVVDSDFICIGKSLLKNMGLFLFGFIASMLILYLGARGYLRPYYLQLGAWITRLMQHMRQKVYGFIVLLVAVLLAGFSAYTLVGKPTSPFSLSEYAICVDDVDNYMKTKRQEKIEKKIKKTDEIDQI